ncbi:MAG: hypothetical protein WDO69_19945 [Pseudomonadota bacterium]
MMNLRSVGALLAISTALSCATAINDEAGGSGPPAGAGSDSGGSAGLPEEGGAPAGGAPAGGAPQAGTPGTAGKGAGGSGAGGKGGGSAGSVGKGGGGGTVGVAGTGPGGKAGTGSSGAAGSVGGSTGTAGGDTTGPCDNPVDLPGTTSGNSGNFNSLEAKCFRTKSTFNTIGCSNFADRTLKVNGVAVVCKDGTNASAPFAPAIDGSTYFDVSAGSNLSANFYWYTS